MGGTKEHLGILAGGISSCCDNELYQFKFFLAGSCLENLSRYTEILIFRTNILVFRSDIIWPQGELVVKQYMKTFVNGSSLTQNITFKMAYLGI